MQQRVRVGFYFLVNGIIFSFFLVPSFFVYNLIYHEYPENIINKFNIIIFIFLIFVAFTAEFSQPFKLSYSKQGIRGRIIRMIIFCFLTIDVLGLVYLLVLINSPADELLKLIEYLKL